MKLKNILFIIGALVLISIYLYGLSENTEITKEEKHKRFIETSEQIKPLLKENFNTCRDLFWYDNPRLATDCYYKAISWDVIIEPYYPNELFYVFRLIDNAYVSQSRTNHFQANGLLSDDIATGGKKLNIYAPDFYGDIKEYKVKTEVRKGKGELIQLHTENFYFELGHAKLLTSKDVVRTGEYLGRVLCPDDENSGVSTGCHIDFSYWVNDGVKFNQTEYKSDKNYNPNDRIDNILNTKQVNTETHLQPNDEMYKGYDTPWQILSAIHMRESGRQRVQPKTSSAGAKGAMQFMPNTWKGYCPELDINNLQHSITCADRYLQANLKTQGTWIKAIWRYNQANWYVAQVLDESYKLGLELNEEQMKFILKYI